MASPPDQLGTPAPEVLHAQICERLKYVSAQHSQADVSRKTGTSPNNISRYMRGGKAPLEFGAALARGLGVNPAWLLTGEGAAYLSDVPQTTGAVAGDILHLVESMNAVMKLRLGTLTGKEHAKVLRDLDEALNEYERLRQRLNKDMRPVIEQMLDQAERAYAAGKARLAEDLSKAAGQLMRFCEEEALAQRHLRVNLRIETRRGNFENVLALQRQRFRGLMGSGEIDDLFLRATQDLIASLGNVGYRAEARRVVRAALTLGDHLTRTKQTWLLSHWEGELDCFLGDMHAGLPKLLGAYNHFDAELASDAKHKHLFWLLVAGAISIDEALAGMRDTPGVPSPIHRMEALAYLAAFAAWQEDPAGLERVLGLWTTRLIEELKLSEDVSYNLVRLLAEAKRRPDPKLFEQFAELGGVRVMLNSSVTVYRFAGHVYVCQLARCACAAGGHQPGGAGTAPHANGTDIPHTGGASIPQTGGAGIPARPASSASGAHKKTARLEAGNDAKHRADPEASARMRPALDWLIRTDDLLKAMPNHVTIDILDRATHYRNAIELLPERPENEAHAELRQRAAAFFRDHHARGYGCFGAIAAALQ